MDEPAVDVEAVEESKPAGRELVVADPNDEQAIFRALDRNDELQILEELQRRTLDVMLYSFPQGGKKITDLSYAGVQECVRTLNARGAARIEVAAEPAPLFAEVVDDGETYIQATVYARDTLNGGGAWGTSTEPKYMKRRNGDPVLDSFARTKALSKAQRNAEKALIPEEFRQTLIAMYLKDDERVKQIRMGPGAEEMAELPPPDTSEEAEGLRDRARELFTAIRAVHATKFKLPGQFHAELTRAGHSVGTLRDYVASLESLLEAAQKWEAEQGG